VIGRRHDRHARLDAHDADVLEPVVRQALCTVLEAAADADDADRQPMPHGAVPDELVRSQRGERDDRVDERDEARLRQPSRDAHHVLLGDADVEEAIGVLLHERLERHVAEVAGQERDAAVPVGELDQRADEGSSHQPASSSVMA
jgi:hypothetical protein